MSIISRLTTWSVGQVLKAADLNNEFSNVTNVLNNVDGGTTTWNNCNSTASSITTLTPTTLTHGSMKYRRPVLQYSSATAVNLETGVDGTSGEAQILFPDGSLRRDSTTTRINCNLAQTAVLSGAAQSGLRTGSQTSNTWYSFYAVKVTDSASNFVTVADTLLPLQANFASLNTNFGTNGWVYLGVLPNGDNSGTGNAIVKFQMAGNAIALYNACTCNNSDVTPSAGVRLASSASATTLSWSYASGTTVGTNIPANILLATIGMSIGGGTQFLLQDSAATTSYLSSSSSANVLKGILLKAPFINVTGGLKQTASAGTTHDILLTGYLDNALGVGTNPLI